MPIRVDIESTVTAFSQAIEDDVNRLNREFYDNLVDLSPVLTGFFRFNWRASKVRVNLDPTGDNAAKKAFGRPVAGQRVPRWKIGDGTMIYTNATPYADHLERGSSPKAPAGIIGPAIARTEANFVPSRSVIKSRGIF